MDSALYDMGGVREWFGPIPVEADEPVFHHRWEARVFASLLMTNAMLGISEDAFRWAEERLPKAQYLAGYYQRWLATLERLLIDHGVLAPGELDARLAGEQPTVRGHAGPGPLRRALTRRFVRTVVGPMPRWLVAPVPADPGHTSPGSWRHPGSRSAIASRSPRHRRHRRRSTRGARATRGESAGRSSVTTLRRCSPSAAHRGERGPDEHFYTVEFDGRELWGDDAEPGTAVRIDLFESYLEATS